MCCWQRKTRSGIWPSRTREQQATGIGSKTYKLETRGEEIARLGVRIDGGEWFCIGWSTCRHVPIIRRRPRMTNERMNECCVYVLCLVSSVSIMEGRGYYYDPPCVWLLHGERLKGKVRLWVYKYLLSSVCVCINYLRGYYYYPLFFSINSEFMKKYSCVVNVLMHRAALAVDKKKREKNRLL